MRRPRDQRPAKCNIDEERYDRDFLLGEYRTLYLAHSSRPDIREQGASGGVTTELLINLLEQGKINGVLAAGFAETEPLTPCYLFKNDPDEVRLLAGSIYAYMELSQLRNAMKTIDDQPVAVVVQPCHVPTVRRWQQNEFPNIRLIVSFFCGYNMIRDAIPYLLSKTGTDQSQVSKILFRGGPYPGGFSVVRKDGHSVHLGKECYELANLMFLRKGCGKCSLYMGESADIAMGDAWIREHPRHTAVVCRSSAGEEALFSAVRRGRVELYSLPEKTLVRMHFHNLIYKKYGHSFSMNWLIVLFSDVLPRSLVPFSLLARLSYYRRKFKIGVSVPFLDKIGRQADEKEREIA